MSSTEPGSRERAKRKRRPPGRAPAKPGNTRPSKPANRRRLGWAGLLLIGAGLVILAALAVRFLWTRSPSPAAPSGDAEHPAEAAPPAEIVGDAAQLTPGSEIRVFWRRVPVASHWTAFAKGAADYRESFVLRAQESPSHNGVLWSEQLWERARQLGLGKLVEAMSCRPSVGMPGWECSGISEPSPSDSASRRTALPGIKVDRLGRNVLFVDFLGWREGEAEPDCRSDADCHWHGRCAAREGVCIATSDADCAASDDCHKEGHCGARDGRCVATADEQCAASSTCEKDANCAAKDGACVAGSDELCARTKGCREDGRCSARDGRCAVGSDADCRRTEFCANLKKDETCGADGNGCSRGSTADFHPKSAADCRNSTRCSERGQCGYRAGQCVALSDADCQSSEQCKSQGRCYRQPIGTCFMHPSP